MTSVDIDATIKALEYSCKNINFYAVKLITDCNVSHSKIEVCYIDKMNNIDEYSYNMIYKLHSYITTEYALIIQSDGFVINPSAWREEFYNYDYIGAPWPLPNDSFSYRDFFGNIVRVGNGGFSLRSRKLLSLPTELKLEWKPFFGYYNEDGFITCHNRHIFETAGCVFAPLDVAKFFSHEHNIEEINGIQPFGFHGRTSTYTDLLTHKINYNSMIRLKNIVKRCRDTFFNKFS